MNSAITKLAFASLLLVLPASAQTNAQDPKPATAATVIFPVTGPLKVSITTTNGSSTSSVFMQLSEEITLQLHVSGKQSEIVQEITNQVNKVGKDLGTTVVKTIKELRGAEQQKALDKLFDEHEKAVKALLGGLILL